MDATFNPSAFQAQNHTLIPRTASTKSFRKTPDIPNDKTVPPTALMDALRENGLIENNQKIKIMTRDYLTQFILNFFDDYIKQKNLTDSPSVYLFRYLTEVKQLDTAAAKKTANATALSLGCYAQTSYEMKFFYEAFSQKSCMISNIANYLYCRKIVKSFFYSKSTLDEVKMSIDTWMSLAKKIFKDQCTEEITERLKEKIASSNRRKSLALLNEKKKFGNISQDLEIAIRLQALNLEVDALYFIVICVEELQGIIKAALEAQGKPVDTSASFVVSPPRQTTPYQEGITRIDTENIIADEKITDFWPEVQEDKSFIQLKKTLNNNPRSRDSSHEGSVLVYNDKFLSDRKPSRKNLLHHREKSTGASGEYINVGMLLNKGVLNTSFNANIKDVEEGEDEVLLRERMVLKKELAEQTVEKTASLEVLLWSLKLYENAGNSHSKLQGFLKDMQKGLGIIMTKLKEKEPEIYKTINSGFVREAVLNEPEGIEPKHIQHISSIKNRLERKNADMKKIKLADTLSQNYTFSRKDFEPKVFRKEQTEFQDDIQKIFEQAKIREQEKHKAKIKFVMDEDLLEAIVPRENNKNRAYMVGKSRGRIETKNDNKIKPHIPSENIQKKEDILVNELRKPVDEVLNKEDKPQQSLDILKDVKQEVQIKENEEKKQSSSEIINEKLHQEDNIQQLEKVEISEPQPTLIENRNLDSMPDQPHEEKVETPNEVLSSEEQKDEKHSDSSIENNLEITEEKKDMPNKISNFAALTKALEARISEPSTSISLSLPVGAVPVNGKILNPPPLLLISGKEILIGGTNVEKAIKDAIANSSQSISINKSDERKGIDSNPSAKPKESSNITADKPSILASLQAPISHHFPAMPPGATIIRAKLSPPPQLTLPFAIEVAMGTIFQKTLDSNPPLAALHKEIIQRKPHRDGQYIIPQDEEQVSVNKSNIVSNLQAPVSHGFPVMPPGATMIRSKLPAPPKQELPLAIQVVMGSLFEKTLASNPSLAALHNEIIQRKPQRDGQYIVPQDEEQKNQQGSVNRSDIVSNLQEPVTHGFPVMPPGATIIRSKLPAPPKVELSFGIQVVLGTVFEKTLASNPSLATLHNEIIQRKPQRDGYILPQDEEEQQRKAKQQVSASVSDIVSNIPLSSDHKFPVMPPGATMIRSKLEKPLKLDLPLAIKVVMGSTFEPTLASNPSLAALHEEILKREPQRDGYIVPQDEEQKQQRMNLSMNKTDIVSNLQVPTSHGFPTMPPGATIIRSKVPAPSKLDLPPAIQVVMGTLFEKTLASNPSLAALNAEIIQRKPDRSEYILPPDEEEKQQRMEASMNRSDVVSNLQAPASHGFPVMPPGATLIRSKLPAPQKLELPLAIQVVMGVLFEKTLASNPSLAALHNEIIQRKPQRDGQYIVPQDEEQRAQQVSVNRSDIVSNIQVPVSHGFPVMPPGATLISSKLPSPPEITLPIGIKVVMGVLFEQTLAAHPELAARHNQIVQYKPEINLHVEQKSVAQDSNVAKPSSSKNTTGTALTGQLPIPPPITLEPAITLVTTGQAISSANLAAKKGASDVSFLAQIAARHEKKETQEDNQKANSSPASDIVPGSISRAQPESGGPVIEIVRESDVSEKPKLAIPQFLQRKPAPLPETVNKGSPKNIVSETSSSIDEPGESISREGPGIEITREVSEKPKLAIPPFLQKKADALSETTNKEAQEISISEPEERKAIDNDAKDSISEPSQPEESKTESLDSQGVSGKPKLNIPQFLQKKAETLLNSALQSSLGTQEEDEIYSGVDKKDMIQLVRRVNASELYDDNDE